MVSRNRWRLSSKYFLEGCYLTFSVYGRADRSSISLLLVSSNPFVVEPLYLFHNNVDKLKCFDPLTRYFSLKNILKNND